MINKIQILPLLMILTATFIYCQPPPPEQDSAQVLDSQACPPYVRNSGPSNYLNSCEATTCTVQQVSTDATCKPYNSGQNFSCQLYCGKCTNNREGWSGPSNKLCISKDEYYGTISNCDGYITIGECKNSADCATGNNKS